MARAARGRGRRAAPGGRRLSDILAGQPADAATLAELYDLEHDEITEDLAFYAGWASRRPGTVIDLGCGSGRLFRSLLDGGASRVIGLDGSPALIDRARRRIEGDEVLRAAADAGRLQIEIADVRRVHRAEQAALVILAGVLAHLDGPEDAVRTFTCARELLEDDGLLVVDLLGPGGLPPHDLPLSIDWERRIDGRTVVRRSALVRHEAPEGLRVDYRTLTDLVGADGTIARLPAGFRLWYPSPSATISLAAEANLEVVAAFGSHDLAPLDERSDRCIVVLRRAVDEPGTG